MSTTPSPPPGHDDAERPSKSAAEARVDELARTSAMPPRERVLQALRLGHRCRALANANAANAAPDPPR